MKKIGRYEIRETLGRGAMGAVYKVVIPVIHKIAALKSLAPSPKLIEKMGMDRLQEQFIREASLIANIRHPHIVNIWSLEEYGGGRMFYLMEYFCHNLGTLIGESYWADSPSRPVRAEKAVRIVLETLAGLSRLNHADIVHRDVKPFNILLTDAGSVKITDFGLSKKRGESSLNSDDGFIGTKNYAAPEQEESPETVDNRADLFSVGVMLHRMLTGHLPGAFPEGLSPLLDADWAAFIRKSMAPNPDDRFQDARQMAEALECLHTEDLARKIQECSLTDEVQKTSASIQKRVTLRSDADRIDPKRAAAVFDLNELAQPKTFVQNDLETAGNGTVTDKTTGLVWQQAGSDYSIPLKEAQAYIDQLNTKGFGGYDRWRMPTVNELLSLLHPPPPGEDFCLESPFSRDQKWIWSGDSRSVKAFWVVNVEMGFAASSDVTDFYYVKGVCSL